MSRRATRRQLAHLEVRPSRSMGQNFLVDDNLARWIAETVGAIPDDTLVEIGPGLGAVTRHLIGRARRLILVEKDARLAADLRTTHTGDPKIEVVEADAAELDLRPFFKHGPLKLVGNLPYSVGTTIMTRWLETPSPVGHALFMLQKEVCDRVTAPPRSGDYGQLSVRLQARWVTKQLCDVLPESFHPRPAVQSAVVSLRPRNRHELPVFDEPLFTQLVRTGFSQRRKQLKNVLTSLPCPWPDLCAALEVPETARAEELSVAQWVELTRRSDPHPLSDHPQSAEELFDVVDETDHVIGQRPRAEVHARELCHRAVHVFAFTQRGDLLLQKRSHLKDTCPGLWDSSAAGHLDVGESYAACAVRELEEELGLDRTADPPKRIARLDAGPETGWEFVELFTVTADPRRLRLPAAEIEAVLAFPPDEIASWIAARPQDFAPGFRRCWEEWNASMDRH
ncbi:MAG: 16S rRNA (adenine(1518)-N(6)/adenine(1519)-N(6))-dimethyltransferase RsmA [Verrucomicrobiales bacterium]